MGAIAVWLVVSSLGQEPESPLTPGPYQGTVLMRTDVFEGPYGTWAIGSIPDGEVLVELDHGFGRGDRLEVRGRLTGAPGMAAGRGYRAILRLLEVVDVTESRFLPHYAGRAIRQRVVERLSPFDGARALLSGFLIGDTSHIAETDIDAMRRSGLAHFVAVSGSNVALFLGLLAVVAGPLALGPRRRAVVGLFGLPIYAAATSFEPSVMRASVMAGIALGARLAGVVLEAWQLLSLAVVALVLVDPGLTSNVGFQLSVAATAGVLVGSRWPVSGVVRRALAITMGAQLAVAPLILFHFGSVPLLSPVANLVAAPIVTMSTVLGALGAAGAGFLIGPAAWLAGIVLVLARGAAQWPQLGSWHVAGAVVAGLVVARFPRVRPLAVTAAALALITTLVLPGTSLEPGSVAVLDVGQGDAILLHGGQGRFALVDGGPDAGRLIDRLRSFGVGTIELVVLTHVHADHATGLTGLVGQVGIGVVWEATDPHSTPASRDLLQALDRHAVPRVTPRVGDRWDLGALEIRVEAPLRQYASPNDQSIVLTVEGSDRSMLLSGDIETIAQGELNHLRSDVLKVPHQGAATSVATWLKGVGATTAIISVGPNQFGHPAQWVIELLEHSGASVARTDIDGDVIVDLGTQ
jgi:competence protein ComEC